MTKVEALKKLFETLGGDPDEVVNETQIAEMIDKISEVAEGGGGGVYVHNIEILGTEGGTIYATIINDSEAQIQDVTSLYDALKDRNHIVASGWFSEPEFSYLVTAIYADLYTGKKRICYEYAYNTEEQTFNQGYGVIYLEGSIDYVDGVQDDV